MYLLYADESGNTGTDLDNKQQPMFVLCGLAVKSDDWYNINYMFQKKKEEICPDLKSSEVHTTDIFSASKNIKKGYDFRKYTLEEDLNILEQLVDFIVDMKFPIFVTGILKSNFKKFIAKELGPSIKIDPYLLSFINLSNGYNNFLIENKTNGMIFLDEVREKVKDIDILYDKLQLTNFGCDTNNIIEKALFLESSSSNFIQLVDVCNFYINKYYSIHFFGAVKNPIKKQHCIDMYNKICSLIINCSGGKDSLIKFFK